MAVYRRVLVADDDPDMLAVLADALARLGYEVVQVQSGEGLVDQLANEGPFDLIVSDISMPWMDGLKALRTVRTAGLATPVIVMTGLTNSHIQTNVQALGSNAILLRKPFDFDELEAAVERLMPSARP